MFNDADGGDFKKVVVACGYTDGRLGINGLASLISLHYKLDPYEKGILFLFCGRRKDRCKGILWEGDGFLPPPPTASGRTVPPSLHGPRSSAP